MLVRRFFSKSLMVAGLLLGAVASSLGAQSGAARWADSVRGQLDRAVIAGDLARISAARALAERALQAFPDDAMLLHYQGTALWREGQMQNVRRNEDAARATFQRAIEILQRSAAARPLPETHAVIASAYGTLAGGGMTAAMRNGPRANDAEERARELGPQNPRVLLLVAISAYYKPAAFGGGKDKARTALRQALTAFERDRPASPLPAWGHAEAYAWLGQFEAAEGNVAAARAAYERALALEPEYAWVRNSLLPALNRPR